MKPSTAAFLTHMTKIYGTFGEEYLKAGGDEVFVKEATKIAAQMFSRGWFSHSGFVEEAQDED